MKLPPHPTSDRHHAPTSIPLPSWIHHISVLGMFGCMAVSYPLWFARTDFPEIPLFSLFLGLPPHTSTFMTVVLVFALLISFTPRWQKLALFTASWLVLVLIGVDLVRFQPWAYHFSTLFILLAFFREPATPVPSATQHNSHALGWMCCWTQICIYVWSGWHKVHLVSTKSALTIAVMVLPIPSSWHPGFVDSWGIPLNLTLGILETAFGLGLLWTRTRRSCVLLLTAMHLLILVALLRMQHDANVYPWNLACIALLWILFWKTTTPLLVWPNFLRFPSRFSWFAFISIVVLVLYMIGPFFHTWDRWDPNLSFALYTGNYGHHQLLISPAVKTKLTPQMQPYASVRLRMPLFPPTSRNQQPASPKRHHRNPSSFPSHPPIHIPTQPHSNSMHVMYELDLYRWSLQRFRTTSPPSPSFYQATLTHMCQQFPHDHIVLVWQRKWMWFHAKGLIHVQGCHLAWTQQTWPTEPPE